MNVRLISYSQPPENLYVGDNCQELVAYCARVSNPSNQENHKTSDRLLSYLAKHEHWSPFEMVSCCLEIETTRDIARQILRHRSFSFQEFSQRYANPDEDLNLHNLRETRLQDEKNRQNSVATEDVDLMMEWLKKQSEAINAAKTAYTWAIENNIAKEQARAVLPEGTTGSRMYMNGTLRSWMHYINIRSGIETQKEHREIARACAEAIEPIFPIIKKYVKNDQLLI